MSKICLKHQENLRSSTQLSIPIDSIKAKQAAARKKLSQLYWEILLSTLIIFIYTLSLQKILDC